MAITATLIEQTVQAAASTTSAGVTPTDGILFILASTSSSSDFGNTTATLSTSGGGTITTVRSSTVWGSRRASLLAAVTGWSSGDTFTVSNNGGGDQSSGICIIHVTGVDGTTPYSGGNSTTYTSGTTKSVAVTTTPDTGDATLSVVVHENNEAVGTEAGWAELSDSGEANGVRRMGSAWDADADTECTFTFSNSGSGWVASVVLEKAAGGTQAITPTGRTVTVTPGTASLARSITPTGPTVAVTPGTATVTLGGATVPGAVNDLAGTAGNAEVVLTWSAPPDGGSTITDYIVHYRET